MAHQFDRRRDRSGRGLRWASDAATSPEDSSLQLRGVGRFRWVGGQAESLALELRAENPILLERVVDDLLLATIQPARERVLKKKTNA